MASPDPSAQFISRWSKAEAAERANYVLFLSELCDLLDVSRPEPAGTDMAQNAYVFERAVTFHHRGGKTSTGRIDLYKRGAFVCECKQYANLNPETMTLALAIDEPGATAKKGKIARGSEAWDRAMIEAQGQAERYARSLPANEDPPPFLLVVDVGHVFELYADFSQKGKAYLPFPDARAHRIRLADLAREEVRAKLRTLWLDPHALDPSKVSAAVTREVAGHLAELAKSFEQKHDPATVAAFLSRCLFCMFAEDIELLPKDSFSRLLDSVKGDPRAAVPLLQQLFAEMNAGKFSVILRQKILHFNGGLFAEAKALPLDGTQLGLLSRAARLQWRHVEPAIFGTLLERALNPAERHKLGAHYTPRAYVERLVLPTVVEPLREEWTAVKTAAVTLASRGDLKDAIKETRAFLHRLCAVRVLDPACGSGNFLYVTLEHLKRLEGEVLQLIESFGENMRLDLGGETVDPHQFLGIELNPRAATIAELVLWIGYLQWHHRNRGATEWPEPVLRAFKNIECRDAVLTYDEKGFLTIDGQFCSLAHLKAASLRYVWDRKTCKTDPFTGREVPDDKAVVVLDAFLNPRPAEWPQVDFIVGNPPFLGAARMREDLGAGYTETLRAVYPAMPESADFVMFWWHKAAEEVLAGRTRRFGFITTNSIRQTFNRRIVQAAMGEGLYLTFAIPDHPWIDSIECAAVRIAMTVGASSQPPIEAQLHRVTKEIAHEETGENEVKLDFITGKARADLTTGADATGTISLKANDGLTARGMMLGGSGFIVTADEAKALGLDKAKGLEKYIRPTRNGRDLTENPRGVYAIDLNGLSEEMLRTDYPKLYQHLLTTVKPERDQNNDPKLRKYWWLHRRTNGDLRRALLGLGNYIATVETAKHRFFQSLDEKILPDNLLVVIALDDAFYLGVLSSRIHVVYALAAGGRLGVGNDPRYNKSRCFDPFPFPDCTEKQKDRIRKPAEELDAHRKRVQEKHKLGLTDIYNVLEKVRNFARAQLSRAEQSRAEQSRAEQSRAEQSRAEQSRAEQSRAEQSRAEQSRATHREGKIHLRDRARCHAQAASRRLGCRRRRGLRLGLAAYRRRNSGEGRRPQCPARGRGSQGSHPLAPSRLPEVAFRRGEAIQPRIRRAHQAGKASQIENQGSKIENPLAQIHRRPGQNRRGRAPRRRASGHGDGTRPAILPCQGQGSRRNSRHPLCPRSGASRRYARHLFAVSH
ncbi:MAG: DNA methyltransferase [Lacunisphaera sp.]